MRNIFFVISLPPITKKNHQRIRYKWSKDKETGAAKKTPFIAQSEAYERYEEEAGWFIRGGLKNLKISTPVNVKCTYYMPDKRRVDLTNLLEATDDVLVHYGVLEDDNSRIIVSHDGSRVYIDRANPRTEIEITAATGIFADNSL